MKKQNTINAKILHALRIPFYCLCIICFANPVHAQVDINLSPYPDIEFGIYHRLPDGTMGLAYPVPPAVPIDFGLVGETGTENVTWSLNAVSHAGVTINSSTGVLTVPLIAAESTITFNVSVTCNDVVGLCSDAGNNSDQQSFIIHILRKPISLRLVLDRSGSMRWCVGTDVNCPAPTRRWDYLSSAIGLLMTKLDEVKITGDTIGISYFHTTTALPLSPPFNANGVVAIDSDAVGIVNGEIGAQTPDGWTAMGEGLIDAKNRLPAPSDNVTRLVILFTDGEQNRGRQVLPGGTSAQEGAGAIETINNGAGSQTIKIYPVAIFGPGGYLSILQDIAGANNPQSKALYTGPLVGALPPTSEDFATYLSTDAFTALLHGNSPQLIDIRTGTITSDTAIEEEFISNKEVETLLFQVVSADSSQRPFEFRVEKDGVDVSQFGKYSFGKGYGLFTIKFPVRRNPTLTSDGKWKLKISGMRDRVYSAAATADDHNFNYDYGLGATQFKVNDPFKFNVDLSHLGKGVTNASVAVTILKPGDDLGDLLARNPLKVDPSDGLDVGSVGLQKYYELLHSDPAFVNALLPKDQVINLSHAGNGKYTGEFTGTDLSGVYQVTYRVKSDSAATGTIERIFRQSVNIRFGDIDPDKSQGSVQINDQNIILSYMPVTIQDRRVGPAFADYINVVGNNIKVQNIQDNGDGSYIITLSGDPNSPVKITVLDEEVYSGNIEDFGKDLHEEDIWKKWWIWLILLIVFLIIYLIRMKKKGP